MSETIHSSNYELYRVFYYVASYSSLTKAAMQLGVSQPAVSQSLKQLESMLGVKLTVRTGHGIKLTPEGEILFPYIEKGCRAFESGEVELSAYLEGRQIRPAPKPAKAKASEPPKKKVTQNITPTPVKETVPKTIPEQKTVAEEKALPEEKVSSVPSTSQLYFVTGTQYRHFVGQKLPLRILEHLPVVLPGYGDRVRTGIDTFLKSKGIKIYPNKEFFSYDDVIDSVIHNEGISCLPESLITPYVESGKLFKLEFEEELPSIEI